MQKRSRRTSNSNRSRKNRTPKPKALPLPKKQKRDENQMAYDLIQQVEALGASIDGKDPLAQALGRRGGLKGGRARVDNMTKAELSESARKAARARWDARKID